MELGNRVHPPLINFHARAGTALETSDNLDRLSSRTVSAVTGATAASPRELAVRAVRRRFAASWKWIHV
jgi:hypothetical protein